MFRYLFCTKFIDFGIDEDHVVNQNPVIAFNEITYKL